MFLDGKPCISTKLIKKNKDITLHVLTPKNLKNSGKTVKLIGMVNKKYPITCWMKCEYTYLSIEESPKVYFPKFKYDKMRGGGIVILRGKNLKYKVSLGKPIVSFYK